MAGMRNGLRACARDARRAPASWRVLVLALALGAASRCSAYLLPAIAVAAMFLGWSLLAPLASSQVEGARETSPGKSGAGFLSGLLVMAGLLLFANEPIGYIFAPSPHRQVIMVLTAVAAFLSVTAAMSAQGWRLLPATAAGATAFVALAADVLWSNGHLPTDAAWSETFLRLLAVFVVAEIAGSPIWRIGKFRLGAAARYATLLMMLALVQRTPSIAPEDDSAMWWWLALVAGVVAWVVWLARMHALQDLRWLFGRHSERAMPAGVATSLGFLPAVGLAGFANWQVWTLAFALGLANAVLQLAYRADGRKPAGAAGLRTA